MTAVAEAIKKVATGPHLSKDLTLDESRAAMQAILAGEVDPVQAAVLLIALRMKRETDDENLGMLQAMQAVTAQENLSMDDVMILSDPFNGFGRHCPVAAFLPAVLAACGLPTVSQGVYEMGPKFGVTHAQVLSAAGRHVSLSASQISAQLKSPECGWAYSDQAQLTPGLFALQTLRKLIIKRPSLATLEKLLMPVKARRTHLLIGFVHKAYPPVLDFLARAAGYDSAFIVRGLEGGVVPTLRETSMNYLLQDGTLHDMPIDPADFGINQATRGVVANANQADAKQTAELGLAALAGDSGVTRDVLILGGAMALLQTGKQASPQHAADQIRAVLDDGSATAHFQQAT
ncbi:Anthranilate phosphoribosyltransferase [Methylophaga frappieri]|uniref:Anthranilate phosphoribosyltransferase n=1 Tax=Methylophaga frappieri (strain ATCC BAA-2434 / DSM 25690 / JAM7) TaxID=754477 RepID=I1YE82_METFJ|nr:glycosyl transferase [Methylophaga frappieri]AFJ01225.1 Anthranilate phosphoribosyltransferase [Methylophaga frappieri]